MKMAAVIVDVGGNSVNSRTAVQGCLYYSVSISPTPALLPLGIERASFAAPSSGNFLRHLRHRPTRRRVVGEFGAIPREALMARYLHLIAWPKPAVRRAGFWKIAPALPPAEGRPAPGPLQGASDRRRQTSFSQWEWLLCSMYI